MYAAPEALQLRKDNFSHIGIPERIDVYSFGIVAFEVLTGEYNLKLFQKSRTKFRKGVIKGTLRPPLREECQKNKKYKESQKKKGLIMSCLKSKFIEDDELATLDMRCWHLQDEKLIFLIESCWDQVPSKRPSFEEIGKNLNEAKVRLREKMFQCGSTRNQGNSVPGPSRASKVPSGGWEADQQALDSQYQPGKRARSSGSSRSVYHFPGSRHL